MIVLVPEWAHYYGEFWKAIRLRNLWFIRLRYLAVLVLLGFLILGHFLLDFQFSSTQIQAISIISATMFTYNVIINRTRNYAGVEPNKFNALHISLIQMVLDLTALMTLVYFTGTIDSPLYMFFIFHAIIGSMILPGRIVYIIAAIISAVFSVIVFLERFAVIGRHVIHGLFLGERNHTLTHDILFLSIFACMLFVSVYLANKIVRQLYRREQQLRSTLEKLKESEIAKQKYTMGIVHEIKTPISAVMAILELIHSKYVGPVSNLVDEKVVRAKKRTEEALQLINDILQISKLKLLEIKPTADIDINEPIAKIIDEVDESLKEKNITYTFKDNRKENKLLRSDKTLIELALSNIITNAVKYVDKGGKVAINLDDKNENLLICVCDNGIGIPEQEIHRIFDQFYRASNINKLIHEGSGLGLALVREIIEKLGGTINVVSPSYLSQEGKPGTSFEINIPYRYKEDEFDLFEVNDQEYLTNRNKI